MNNPGFDFKLGFCALALGLSGWANAACYIGAETNATSVQADSGNGTYNCALVSTSNGTLANVSGITWSVVNGKVNWSVPVNTNGYPTVDVDLVSVAASSGKRCNYSYANQPAAGAMLSTSDGSIPKDVTVCADGIIAPEPPPPPPPPPPTPEPFTTLGDGCVASFTETPNASFDVAIGYSKDYFEQGGTFGDNTEGLAVCTQHTGQNECVNECVTHVPAATTVCTADASGKLPLDCRACEYEYADPADSNKDLKYCWYYENHVDLNAGTFKPSPKKKSLSAQIDVTTGSNCYTVTVGPMYGGKTYSYQYCQ